MIFAFNKLPRFFDQRSKLGLGLHVALVPLEALMMSLDDRRMTCHIFLRNSMGFLYHLTAAEST